MATCLDGNIPAVCLIHEVFERNNQFIRLWIAMQTVVVVIDSNKPHTEDGKNFLNVRSCFQMVTAKTG